MSEPALGDWPARYFDGVVARPRPCRVRVENGQLVVAREDGATRRVAVGEVTVVGRGGRGPVQLRFGEEEAESLVAEGEGLLEALAREGAGRRPKRAGVWSVGAGRLLVIAAACAALLFAAWRWGVPALARAAADVTPAAWERSLGDRAMQALARHGGTVDDPLVTGPARAVLARVAAAVPAPADRYRLVVLASPEANAFAAPGGSIGVTTALLRALGGPEELAAVLAHEVAHLERRHPTRALYERLGLRALLHLLAGDGSGLQSAADAAGSLTEFAYSRRDELEADRLGSEYVARAGVPPTALADALGSLARARPGRRGAVPDFLSTHPATAGRIARLAKSRAGERLARAAPLVRAEDWAALRDALASRP